jgi:hypothetical protein
MGPIRWGLVGSISTPFLSLCSGPFNLQLFSLDFLIKSPFQLPFSHGLRRSVAQKLIPLDLMGAQFNSTSKAVENFLKCA